MEINAMSQDTTDSDSWCTPEWLCEELGEFGLDPCSNDASHVKAPHTWALPVFDGIKLSWLGLGSVFVNPPYSAPLPWCTKLASHRGPWCALLKLDPTTKWYAVLAEAGASIAPFRKRIAFERADKPPLTANFPSMLAWGGGWQPSSALAARLWMPVTRAALAQALALVDRAAWRRPEEQMQLRALQRVLEEN
jgi:hypothetical protein